jgi:hypothetical protein
MFLHTPPYFKCDQCGKFCGDNYDEGTFYGSYWDLEPPDPQIFCKKCSSTNIQKAIQSKHLAHCWWKKPNWYRIAHSILKHQKQGYKYERTRLY